MTFTQASFLISAISMVLGAVVSYKIYLLITGTLVTKVHRWLAQLAVISIAIGIGFISNEILGSIFLGLTTRQEFILGKLITNLFFLPTVLIGIIWISGGFKQRMNDGEEQLGLVKNKKDSYEKNDFNKNRNSSGATFLIALVIIGASVFFYNMGSAGSGKTETNKEQQSNKASQIKEEPNFFNGDMSYTLKNCYSDSTTNHSYEFEKLKTSIDDRDAVLIGQNQKIYFEQCFLNGRHYQCKTKFENEQILKITFDVIEQNFWHEEIDINDDKKINKSTGCQAR